MREGQDLSLIHIFPAEDGLYRLKDELRLPDAPDGAAHTPRFLVTGEISSIYKKDGDRKSTRLNSSH